jgi:hypothetical protein
VIDGLKLTMSGEELRTLIDEGVRRHERRASPWPRETLRTTDDETEHAPLRPQHICENEAERHTWRASVLTFLGDHIDGAETYRLCVADLEAGDLLPEKPGWLEQDEYEERTRIGFNLERLVKSVNGIAGLAHTMQYRAESDRNEFGATRETVIEETDEFRTSRIDLESGPEIIKIERAQRAHLAPRVEP